MFGGPYDGVGGCLEGLMMGLVGVWRALWWGRWVFGGPYDGVGGCLEGLMMGLVGVWRAL